MEEKSLHTNQVAHQAGAYPCFRSMKRLRVSLHPLNGMLVHPVTPSIKFAATHFYARVERGAVSVEFRVQKDTENTMSPVRIQTWTTPSTLNMRAPSW